MVISWGELINLYSTEKNRVPTKDIDLKLYFTGDSLDPKIYKNATSRIKPIHLKQYDLDDKERLSGNFSKGCFFKRSMARKTPSGKTYLDIWSQVTNATQYIMSNLLINNLKGNIFRDQSKYREIEIRT